MYEIHLLPFEFLMVDSGFNTFPSPSTAKDDVTIIASALCQITADYQFARWRLPLMPKHMRD